MTRGPVTIGIVTHGKPVVVPMKYCFTTKFWYDEDDVALANRLAQFFGTPLLRNTVLGPRSARLPPTPANLAAELGVAAPEPDAHLSWATQVRGKPVNGQLHLTRNSRWGASRFTSFIDLKFALSAGYKGGPFADADEVLAVALAAVQVGPSLIGLVETGDEDPQAAGVRNDLFRTVDTMAVPESIEWVTVLHRTVLDNMGVELRRAERVEGVRVGTVGDYGWVVLGDEPFRFADPACLARYQRVAAELGLARIHGRFPGPAK